MPISDTKLQLLTSWHKRLREVQNSHYEAAKPLASMNLRLGIPVVLLTTLVGTSVFASLQKEVHIGIKIAVGFISVTAAILASLQTFLRFSEKAEIHRSIGAHAGVIRREVEQLFAMGDIEHISEGRLNKIREQIDQISINAPSIPDRIWKRIQAEPYKGSQ